jgi:hypothetical protein
MDTPTTVRPTPSCYGSADICAILGIGYSALVRLRATGEGPPCTKVGSTWQYPIDAYHAWYAAKYTPQGTGHRPGDPNRETWADRKASIRYGHVDPASEKRNQLEYALWARREPQLAVLVLGWRLRAMSWTEIRDTVKSLVGSVGVSHEAYRGWFPELANQRQRIDPAMFDAMVGTVIRSAA